MAVCNSRFVQKLLVGLVVVTLAASAGQAQQVRDDIAGLNRINIVDHSGDTIPLDLEFVDASGNERHLADFFQTGRPVILTLGYYECPMLCNLVFNGLAKGVSGLKWKPGGKYQMLTVGISQFRRH